MSKLSRVFAASLMVAACGSSSPSVDGGGGHGGADAPVDGAGGTGGTGGTGGIDGPTTVLSCIVICGANNACPDMFTSFMSGSTCFCAPAAGGNPTGQAANCNNTNGQGCVCSASVSCPASTDTCFTITTPMTGAFCSNACTMLGSNSDPACQFGGPGTGRCVQFSLTKEGPHGGEWAPDLSSLNQ